MVDWETLCRLQLARSNRIYIRLLKSGSAKSWDVPNCAMAVMIARVVVDTSFDDL